MEDDITSLFLRKEDADKLWRCERRKVASVEISRMRNHYRKVREGVARKLKRDNAKAFRYESGMMMGPEATDEAETDPPLQQKEQQKGYKRKRKRDANDGWLCHHCGLIGHLRISHSECLKNPNPKTPNITSKKAKTEAAVVGKWKF